MDRNWWAHWLNLLLGAWLLASPFALGSFAEQEFRAAVHAVTAERGLWDPALRMQLLGVSDLVSAAIMAFALFALSPRR
jgi:hypothetical protein